MIGENTIVAELSKNYWEAPTRGPTLAQLFETVINRNADRGYELDTWRLSSTIANTPGGPILNETIIAVFQRIPRTVNS